MTSYRWMLSISIWMMRANGHSNLPSMNLQLQQATLGRIVSWVKAVLVKFTRDSWIKLTRLVVFYIILLLSMLKNYEYDLIKIYAITWFINCLFVLRLFINCLISLLNLANLYCVRFDIVPLYSLMKLMVTFFFFPDVGCCYQATWS